MRLYLKPGLGPRSLSHLSVPLVQSYVNGLITNGHSISKEHVIRKVLSAALPRAERDELKNRNVARLVELPSEDRKETKPWSAAEVVRFLEVVRPHVDRRFQARRRQWLIGVVAVNLAVKKTGNTEPTHAA